MGKTQLEGETKERGQQRRNRYDVSDEMWERIEGLIPVPTNTHPRGGGRKRVPYRTVMNGIFFVLRTGCQWKALDATGICSGSTAHARLQEWTQAGVFEGLWQMALEDYDELKGIDWKWVCMDGAITKSPLGGEKNRAKSNGSSQRGNQTQPGV